MNEPNDQKSEQKLCRMIKKRYIFIISRAASVSWRVNSSTHRSIITRLLDSAFRYSQKVLMCIWFQNYLSCNSNNGGCSRLFLQWSPVLSLSIWSVLWMSGAISSFCSVVNFAAGAYYRCIDFLFDGKVLCMKRSARLISTSVSTPFCEAMSNYTRVCRFPRTRCKRTN